MKEESNEEGAEKRSTLGGPLSEKSHYAMSWMGQTPLFCLTTFDIDKTFEFSTLALLSQDRPIPL